MLKRLVIAVAALTLLTPAPAESAEGKQIRFKFGTLAPDNTPWSKLLVDFEKEMDKRSGGRAKMKTFLGGILGDERAMLQKMKFGQLQGGGFSTGGLATVAPELQLLEIPFLFRNSAETDYVLDHVVREDMAKALEKRGLFLLSWAENGWIDFGNQKRPVHSPADMRDIKWFTQESDVGIAFFKALNVTAVPLAVPEVLSSLQTGVVEAYESTPVFASGAQWYSQTKYWTVSHHRYQPAAVVAELKFWNKLDPADREMAIKIARELEPRSRAEVRGLDAGLLEGFRKEGIQINELTEKERAEFEKVTAVVGENLVKQGVIPAELLKKTQNALTEFRAKAAKAKK